ncbi:MAG: hypothetical protein P8M17_11650 [Saprospiraceae bacterium]|nr:hypothetical protein [Saprospiraceae bacterium]MDG1434147.1 hypothetical protein [Saprospiraceae bacterium]MDG2419640.1 hypothetical protein [Saprospiraceae bacterium]
MYNNNLKNKKFHPIKILGIAGMVVLFLGIAGGVVMFLWNAIIPEVTGWKPLTYWQSIGLLVLFKILFGGFGRGSGRHHHRRSRWKVMRNKWRGMGSAERKQMKEKWMHMNKEEKRAFKQKWKNYCKGKEEE